MTGHHVFGVGPFHTAVEYVPEKGDPHSISAGPKWGRLVSGVDTRASDKPDKNDTLGLIIPPPGTSDAEFWALLKELDANYRDNIDSDLNADRRDGANSNTFTRGLLDAAGATYTAPFGAYWGGSVTLPTSPFAPPWLRGPVPADMVERQSTPMFRRLP